MNLRYIVDVIALITGVLLIPPLIIMAYALAIKIVKDLYKKRRE